MAPNLLDNSAEPVQIISSPQVQHAYNYSRPIQKVARPKARQYKWEIVWKNVLIFVVLHSAAIYGLGLVFTKGMWKTMLFAYVYAFLCGMGITAGAHRLWAHRTYKAKLPLRIFLMLCQSGALQNHIYEWSRDHRVHHKFTDTDADPHNSRRGFFFSHMGWLMVKKHKDVFVKGKTVDLSDLEADPVVMFQKKYYIYLIPLFCFIIPAAIPWYFWGENAWISWYAVVARYTLSLNGTWLVNSAAHIYGTKPYDKIINPTENTFVAIAAFGEGWHNYHHVFPWDYKAAELGNYRLNFTTAFLDLMAKIGWAYDLKTASPDMVMKRTKRTGDGSWVQRSKTNVTVVNNDDHHHNHADLIWGWGDTDMEEDVVKDVKLFNKLHE